MQARTTLYIAGAMSGIKDFNRSAFFSAEESLKRAGYTPVNPFVDDFVSGNELAGGLVYEQVLAHSLAKMIQCDAVALLPGWEKSHGATIEKFLAQELFKPVETLEYWLSR